MTITREPLAGLQAFAKFMIRAAFEGADVDGPTIQEEAAKHGLLRQETMPAPCCGPDDGYCRCAWSTSFPAECYRMTEAFTAQAAPVAETVASEVEIPDIAATFDGLYLVPIKPLQRGDHLMTIAQHNRIMASAPPHDTELVKLLAEARETFEMWKDVAPAVSLCADIDAKLASLRKG